MTAQELRQKYLKFFEGKGHVIIPSASLIPENDSSVLFTMAGMHPLVPFLMGQTHPAGKRLTNVQKSIRTIDIEQVGDDIHLTFFEMLGSWSLGDYGKKQAIEWSFEFLTGKEWLNLPIDRLAFSVYAGDEFIPKDEEATGYWKSLGVFEERIAYLGEENFWIAGSTGPSGPTTEMFFWADSGTPAPKNFQETHTDPRWVEIWNDVFMEYEKLPDGKTVPLKQKNVDTGMGLDRTLAVLNGQTSVYDTELFKPLFDVLYSCLERTDQILTGDEVRKARVIVDHVRASVFIVNDGVEPSNKERGYVLRRLLRRSMVNARLLNLRGHWLEALLGVIVTTYVDAYPDLQDNSEKTFAVILAEQKKFGVTLEKGLKLLESRIQTVPVSNSMELDTGQELSFTGKEAFDLYQTYGFPWELTKELLEYMGQEIDKAEFEEEFKKHQELSRTASSGEFKGGLANHSEKVIKLHTTTHLMHKALRDVLGKDVWQKGSNITEERTRFDFTYPQKMTPEQLKQVEDLVNGWIKQDLSVKSETMPLSKARELGAIGLFGEKYADTVSIYTIYDKDTGEVVSREFCGGPHVEHTGQIAGTFRIAKEEAVSSGIRRVKGVIE